MSAMVLSPAPRARDAATARACVSRVVTERSAVRVRPAGPTTAARTAPGRAGAADLGDLRLTRRGRTVVLVLALAVVVSAVLVGSRASADGPVSAPQVERHVVAPGETLWQIAATITASGDDVRDSVDRLVRLNDLPGASLTAGQVIIVPAG